MKTPEEKVKELYRLFEDEVGYAEGFINGTDVDFYTKNCVKIAIDLRLESCIWLSKEIAYREETPEDCEEFWLIAKEEVEKL